jgi:Rrf2 family cysteine metabolism transcriptional repressor
MKLSTKVRYGTRAMLDLACFYGNGPILLKDIARRQEISVKYLDRILTSLRTAGLVKALRGAKGGYVLNMQPAKINLLQIVEALEGPIELVGCVKNKNFCKRVNFCVAHDIWYELGRAMEAILKTTTLDDLVIKDKKKKKAQDKMYYI